MRIVYILYLPHGIFLASSTGIGVYENARGCAYFCGIGLYHGGCGRNCQCR
ncbi:MAG: hypothetical protein ACTTHE_05670 [Prevotella multiformis]|uniref:hypothetical protein n=1 Tax=Prevotella multiformis TaxID=282402 RepID=UPI001BA749B7|nr:hypothetical protein [Prevotella multiformis]QUB70471.1 hypothetical protein J4864_05350 [Prevotella multiformis]